MDRRHFLVTSAGALTAASAAFGSSPNDTIRVAVIGMGGRWGSPNMGRGKDHINAWKGIANTEMVAICDIDDAQIAKGLKLFESSGLKKPEVYKDFRKVIENKDIDVVSIATPNPWHTLMAIWACQAGKDVYVEKPCSHNIFEAKQIVAAARKYNRMVQQGSQIRSSAAVQEAVQKMRDGYLGDIYLAKGLCYKWRDTIGRAAPEPVPAGVDYDMWTGPSPVHQFTKNRFHYNWHWFWDTGNGDLGNQGIHQVDVARWGLGVKFPTKVTAFGGHFMFDDDQETPNTIAAMYEFNDGGKKRMMEFEVRHWMTNGEATVGMHKGMGPNADSGAKQDAEQNAEAQGGPAAARARGVNSDSIGDIFYGSKGYLSVDSYSSYKSWLGQAQKPADSRKDPDPMHAHVQNFADAVRSRKRESLNAEIEEGAASTVLVHLANISYRMGRTINFDPATITITGDAEAAKMMTRQYRKGFVVPEKV